jgi:hypothetical protein
MCPPGALSSALGGDEGDDTVAATRMSIATELAGFTATIDPAALSAVSTPIFQTATFDVVDQGKLDYTRSGNPTRHALEELCCRIEHAQSAAAFTSGMAALSAVVRLLVPGDEVIASKDIYGGMYVVCVCPRVSERLEPFLSGCTALRLRLSPPLPTHTSPCR